ncbi:MAG: 3-deoxy-7-phosphoheptulonate synthase, partial [Nitrospirota bacterium]
MDIIVLNRKATENDIKRILKKLESRGLKGTISKGTERIVIGVIGDTSKITEDEENTVRVMKGVEEVMRILKPYKLASRDFKSQDTIIKVKGRIIGGKKIPVIAGPCAVENRAMLMNVAEKVKAAGASFIRGGAYKPRTSPYAF